DRRLHRGGDVGLQQLRRGAGPGGADREPGELDAGPGGKGELGERDPAGEHQRHAEGPDDGGAGGGPANHASDSVSGRNDGTTEGPVIRPPLSVLPSFRPSVFPSTHTPSAAEKTSPATPSRCRRSRPRRAACRG